MLENSYFFEKISEFKQKEIEKQSKDWWKYDKTKSGGTITNLFSSVLKTFGNKKNEKNYLCCCCSC